MQLSVYRYIDRKFQLIKHNEAKDKLLLHYFLQSASISHPLYFCLQKRIQINNADYHQSENTCHDKTPLLRTKLSYANLFSTISENVLELTAILVFDNQFTDYQEYKGNYPA